MKTFKLIIRALYALLSLAAIVFYTFTIIEYVSSSGMQSSAVGSADTAQRFLILHLATFIISIPSLINILRFIAGITGKFSLALAAFGIGLVIAPVTLLISTVITVVRLIRDIVSAKAISSDAIDSTSSEIFLVSQDRAARKLLDDNLDEDISIDDGDAVHVFRQIALIEDGDEKYALLSPVDEVGNVAHAYRIYVGEHGTYELEHVTDKTTYTRVYNRYRRLLNS